jgi:hypothetical protein
MPRRSAGKMISSLETGELSVKALSGVRADSKVPNWPDPPIGTLCERSFQVPEVLRNQNGDEKVRRFGIADLANARA